MKRLKNAPVLFLLLALTVPGCGGFDTSIRRGLTASQITYEGAMDAIEEAEAAGIIKEPKAFEKILEYEFRHRTTHNMIVSLSKQYVHMRDAGVDGGELKTVKAQILTFQANLALILAEFVVFLQEIGVKL